MKLAECQKLENLYVANFHALYGFEPVLNYSSMRTMWKRLNGHYTVDKLCDLMTLWFISGKGEWCGYNILQFQRSFNELLIAYSSIPWDNYTESVYKEYCQTCEECGQEAGSYDEWRARIIRENTSLHPQG